MSDTVPRINTAKRAMIIVTGRFTANLDNISRLLFYDVDQFAITDIILSFDYKFFAGAES